HTRCDRVARPTSPKLARGRAGPAARSALLSRPPSQAPESAPCPAGKLLALPPVRPRALRGIATLGRRPKHDTHKKRKVERARAPDCHSAGVSPTSSAVSEVRRRIMVEDGGFDHGEMMCRSPTRNSGGAQRRNGFRVRGYDLLRSRLLGRMEAPTAPLARSHHVDGSG